MTTARYRIGVDLGGTKIEAVAVQLERESASKRAEASKAPGGGPDGGVKRDEASSRPVELGRARVATHRALGYEHVLETTRKLIFDVAKQAALDLRTTPIGVGMPGSVTTRRADGTSPDDPLVKNSNTTCLNGRPFRSDLERAVGRSITFANDADCFALAEATWGAARGARVTFGVIMGTGVGGGIVLTDSAGTSRVWSGAQGIAGEWGHVVLNPDVGPPCYCGRKGCVETYLSGPSIETEYARRTSSPLPLVEIAERASHNDPIARALIAERIEIFGRALATVIGILDPDAIVLGGGVSNVDALYGEGRRAVARWVFNDELSTRIVKHELGDSAGVLGAALLP